MKRKAIIISIKGKFLTKNEAKLIKSENPWGIILFKRNIKSFNQTFKLIKKIKMIVKDNHFPILIDEEGGSVSRLTNLIDNRVYSQKFFGNLFKNDKKTATYLYINYINTICSIFKVLGININTVPVLDILKKKAHKIIGNRSYSSNINIINFLGNLCIASYKNNKIGNVAKHIPGHGRAMQDSHKGLPVINSTYKDLKRTDFSCFKKISSHFVMTAHILYKNIDFKNVATHSDIVIKKIIRKEMKFKGIIISDDISMKALKHDLVTNAKKSIKAGCNIVLYCAGNYSDSLKLLKALPYIDNFTRKKTSEFYKFLS
jgi:beta-N-acetylhexosaminidase